MLDALKKKHYIPGPGNAKAQNKMITFVEIHLQTPNWVSQMLYKRGARTGRIAYGCVLFLRWRFSVCATNKHCDFFEHTISNEDKRGMHILLFTQSIALFSVEFGVVVVYRITCPALG